MSTTPLSSLPPHKRRVRYKGKNPRRFEDKYKEHNPERHPDIVEKVIAGGKTPAGMHRPVCVKEILEILAPQPGDVGLDATLGYGGHAQEVLKRIIPGGRLFGIDVDPVELPRTELRLRKLGFPEESLTIRRTNFAGIGQLVHEVPGGFDFILADLGVSSMQLDNPARGFTFKADGPLDLRMNPNRGKPAWAWLESVDESDLIEVLRHNADEPHAESIGRSICARRKEIQTTSHLADIVRRTLSFLPGATRSLETRKSLQRVFQALRIEVNDELQVLEQFLALAPACLKPGGRIAILTFHSGEDRRVKKAFQEGLRTGLYARIALEPIRPSSEECRSNPRSSCAKLRWAVKSV